MDENRDETTIESKQEHVICGCEEETRASDAEMTAVAKSDEQAEEGILSDYAKKEKPSVKAVVKKYCKRYFIDAFSGMAQGLFCTLIAGTILAQIASWCGDNGFAHFLAYMAKIAKTLMGAGIGIGIAHKLGAKPLVIFTAAVTGRLQAIWLALCATTLRGISCSARPAIP